MRVAVYYLIVCGIIIELVTGLKDVAKQHSCNSRQLSSDLVFWSVDRTPMMYQQRIRYWTTVANSLFCFGLSSIVENSLVPMHLWNLLKWSMFNHYKSELDNLIITKLRCTSAKFGPLCKSDGHWSYKTGERARLDIRLFGKSFCIHTCKCSVKFWMGWFM